MRRRKREGKTANGLRREPARGLARDMGGMVVEDHLDGGVGGVGGVEELEKLDEFATAVAFLDEGMDVTSEQIDPGHQGQRAVALVLVIAHHGRAGAGQWRAIRRGRSKRLDAGFLVVRDDGEALATAAALSLALRTWTNPGRSRQVHQNQPSATAPKGSPTALKRWTRTALARRSFLCRPQACIMSARRRRGRSRERSTSTPRECARLIRCG